MKLRDSASWLPNHLDRTRRLGPSLGPTLVQLPPRWRRNTERLYIRFHGPDAQTRKYWGRYTGRRLRRPAERLADWLAEGHDVYAFFNNDYEGHAVVDAKWLARFFAVR
jgi:uncharacterized protein YecE (DUF72 family)